MVESSLTAKFRTPTTIVIIFKLVTKPNMVEFVFLGPTVGRNGTLMSGRTKNGQTNGEERQSLTHAPKRPQLCPTQPVSSDSMFRLAALVFFLQLFFSAISRPDSSNCHERDGRCRHHTCLCARIRTFFLVRASHVMTARVAQGPRGSRLSSVARFSK